MNTHKSKYLLEQINKLKNKAYEIFLLTPILVDEEFKDIRPFTQYPVKSSGIYFIDLYYPDLKLAIEIDEPHHTNQKEEDKARENLIIESEKCDFKRITISDDFDAYKAINEIKVIIKQKREKQKKEGSFNEWTISIFEMSQAQIDYPNAIFFKATKSFENNSIDPRRGPLKLRPEIREKADTFVTISGETVTNVFSINPSNWEEFKEPNLGFYQNGQEVPNHPLISSGSTKWEPTSNRTLGKNLIEN